MHPWAGARLSPGSVMVYGPTRRRRAPHRPEHRGRQHCPRPGAQLVRPSVAIASTKPSVVSERGDLLVPGVSSIRQASYLAAVIIARGLALRVAARLLWAWQHGQDHADVGAELGHVGAEELSGGVVGDLAVVLEDIGGVLDVGLG